MGKEDKDPNRPKRPTSSYFFYAADQREEAKRNGESISKVAEFTKMVSAKWRELTDAQKKPFEAKAAIDKQRYTDAMATYTPIGGTGSKRSAAAKDPNKPKRAQTAYFLFLADFRLKNKSKYTHSGGHKDLIRGAGEAWNKLTKAEKAPYQTKHEEEKAKYEVAMANYSAGGGGAAKKAKVAAPAAEVEEDDEDDEDDYEDEEDDE